MSSVVALITGGITGCIEATCMWPTENIKTQLQLQGKSQNPKFTNLSGGIKYVWRNQGFVGLYRGLAPIIIGAFPKSGVRFGSNTFFKGKINESGLPLPSTLLNLAGGLCAGATEAVTCVVPMETVKTRTIEMKCGFVESTRHILASSGVAGLYKGVVATVLKQSSNQGLRFMFMGVYRDAVLGWTGEAKLHPMQSLAGGVGAGTFSVLGNNPLDVVKTKMQGSGAGSKYKGTLDCFAAVLRAEGVGGFYAGVLPRIYRVGPGQGITFMCFDALQPHVAEALGGIAR